MLLNIEARIGELSLSEPQERYQGVPKGQRDVMAKPEKHERMGLKQVQMHRAQTISRNPEAVKAVIAEAREDQLYSRKQGPLSWTSNGTFEAS